MMVNSSDEVQGTGKIQFRLTKKNQFYIMEYQMLQSKDLKMARSRDRLTKTVALQTNLNTFFC